MDNEQKATLFIQCLQDGDTVKAAAANAEISTPTIYKWAKKAPAFKAEMTKILEARVIAKEQEKGLEMSDVKKPVKKVVKKVVRRAPVAAAKPSVNPEAWIKRVISEFERAFPGKQLKANDVLTLLTMTP